MKSFQDKFIDAFSEAFVDGDKHLIDEYIDFICRIAHQVWQERCDKNSAYPIESFQNNCKKLLSVCADSDKDESKHLFVRLLDKLYGILADDVRSTKGLYRDASLSKISANGINGISCEKASLVNNNVSNLCTRLYFNIIDFWSVYFFFNKILSKIDIRILRDEVKISNLLYNMQVIDLALFQDRLEIQKRVQVSKNQQDTTGSFGSVGTNSKNSKNSTNRANKLINRVKQTKIDWKPDSSILYIQQYMGLYLNIQLHNPDITTEEITEFAKGFIIGNDCLHSITADYETMSVLVRAFLIENTVYICGLITAGLTDIAKDVFLTYLDSKHNRDNRYYIEASYFGKGSDEFILPITVFCYLYYLGFWEDEKYVSSELRDKVRELVKELSNKYREIFTRQDHYHDVMQVFIDELRTEGNGKFFPRYIYQIMRRFDFRATEESSYTIVTGSMVKDFCLFSIALINPLPNAFDWVSNSDHNIISYLDYIKDEKATREGLAKFIDFTNILKNTAITHGEAKGKTSEEEHEKERLIQVLFERIKLGITSRYKDEIKNEAIKAAAEYKQKREEIEDSCKNLEEKIEDAVREGFGELIDIVADTSVDNDDSSSIRDNSNNNHSGDNSSDINSYHTVEIFTLPILTASVIDTLKSQVKFMTMTAYSNLLQEYILLLIKERCLKPTERARDDKDYINFLDRNDFNLLFGARRFFTASDLEFAEEFDKRIEKYTQIIANGYSKGFRSALIKKEKLHFFIKNVKVEVRDERPFDYKALGDIELPFENEEERRELISNERKVITVQAEIRVEPGKASGAYIEE